METSNKVVTPAIQDNNEDKQQVAMMSDTSVSDNEDQPSSSATTKTEDSNDNHSSTNPSKERIWAKIGRHMAKHPRKYFWLSLIGAIAISAVGIIVGGFSMDVDNSGWTSRGTLIGNRETQVLLVKSNSYDLLYGGDEAWDQLNGGKTVWRDGSAKEDDDNDSSQDTTPVTTTATTAPTMSCYDALIESDENNDGRVSSDEYVSFVNYLNPMNIKKSSMDTSSISLVDLPSSLQDNFVYLACLCMTKFVDGPLDCCIGDNAHIAINGTKDVANEACTYTTQAIENLGGGNDDLSNDNNRRRKLFPKFSLPKGLSVDGDIDVVENHRHSSFLSSPSSSLPYVQRRLQFDESLISAGGYLQGCNFDFYEAKKFGEQLWPVWEVQTEGGSTALNGDIIRDLCVAEESTQAYLVENDLCYGCDGTGVNTCLPPYGLVFYTRLVIPNGFDLTCDELGVEWTSGNYQELTEDQWQECVADIGAESYVPDDDTFLPQSCYVNADYNNTSFAGFSTHLLDMFFQETGDVMYTSSIFATSGDVETLFDHVDSFHRGSELVVGAYDTQYEDFVNLQVDTSLFNDMVLAMGSAFLTAVAILLHTRSPYITLVGLAQIILSFPLAYFVYTLVLQLEFFPFLCFIGVFVIFALGADDIFVAVDKWKNARLEYGDSYSTEEIAAKALPDAASAMLLTTVTTAAAFFATAICPVAGIKMFAIFVGLLVILDYVMCVLLVFPALCIYDKARHRNNCCLRCNCGSKASAEDAQESQDGEEKPSLIRRILTGFYNGLHTIRWGLLVFCIAALGASAYYASTIELPASSDVRLLDPNKFQFEKNFEWRLNLLYDALEKSVGSKATVVWGVTPADTGDYNNPQSFSKLVLDDTFQPSSEESQTFLLGFCDTFYAEDIAERPDPEYVCPMNAFDEWLQEQSSLEQQDEIYVENCNGATSVPVAEAAFDACMSAWAKQVGNFAVLSRGGVVKIIYVTFTSRVRYDDPYDELDAEWHLIEEWMNELKENSTTPTNVANMFFSSEDFWWYDTNGQMLATAYGSAMIALSVAFFVMLFTSRSITLTIFSTVTIAYVLVSVTAVLAAFGWTLGFLESVCFAILIGISCDFVIHFSHSYTTPTGKVSRHVRTKHALIHMGPSILAAAFTTLSAATIMLFTVISFFEKFALILFLTVLQATIGSFIVFLTLADCIGPAEPTYIVDKVTAACTGQQEEEKKATATVLVGTGDTASNSKMEKSRLSITEATSKNEGDFELSSKSSSEDHEDSDETEIWT